MVECLSENAIIYTVFVLVSFIGLLPSEVDEHFFVVVYFLPAWSDFHDSSD